MLSLKNWGLMARRLTLSEKLTIIDNYRHMHIKDVAVLVNRKHETVNNWLNQRGFRKRPNYSPNDIETILSGGEIRGKSKNAIKIKRWRLKNARNKPT